MYRAVFPSVSTMGAGAIAAGEPAVRCFWKKHPLGRPAASAAMPSGQRSSVSGRSAVWGSAQSATTARYAISSPFVIP